MKLIEFPKENDEHKDALAFLEEVRKRAEENDVTSIVVVMLNDEGNLGLSVFADYIEAAGMLALAMRAFSDR